MKRDDMRTLFVVLVVCIICGIIIFFVSRKSNVEKLSYLDDYSTFFSVTSEVNRYIGYIAMNDSNKISSLLDNKYNNSYIDSNSYSLFTSLNSSGIEYVNIGKNYLYLVKGKIIENGFDNVDIIDNNYMILVLHDVSSNCFSIYPVNSDNYKRVVNGIRKISINNNEYNSIISTEEFDDVQVCKLYFSDYYDKLFNDRNEAYNLLSDDMKKKFSDYDEFNTYIKDNVSKISSSSKLCKMTEFKDGRSYSVIDSNDNNYVFTENGVMNYKVDFYFDK